MLRYILVFTFAMFATIASAQTPTETDLVLEDTKVQAVIKEFDVVKGLAGLAYRNKIEQKRQEVMATLTIELERIKKEGTLDDAVKLRDYIAAQEAFLPESEPLPVLAPKKIERVRLPRSGVFAYGGSKYFMSQISLPWWKADEAARSVGGHIVRFETKAEYDVIAVRFYRVPAYTWLDCRIGPDNKWYNSDDQPAELPSSWAPKNPKGNERRHCVVNQSGIHDSYGDHLLKFVIEIEDAKQRAPIAK